MKARLETVDREYKTLLVKYEEITLLYEQTSKDLKVRIAEYNKVSSELEHIKELYERLGMDYKKINGEFLGLNEERDNIDSSVRQHFTSIYTYSEKLSISWVS